MWAIAAHEVAKCEKNDRQLFINLGAERRKQMFAANSKNFIDN
jgi:hypothetical protein